MCPNSWVKIIPDFHNMEFRMKQLREAVATNAAGRLSEVQDIVDAIEKDADENVQCRKTVPRRQTSETYLPLRY